VRAQNGNLMIWAYDAEGGITWRGTADHVCSDCDVDEFMLTMGDLNGDSSYANYTGNCSEVVDTQVSAVIHVPPNYSAYNRTNGSNGTVAGFGKFTGSGGSSATSARTSNAGSVTLDSSISFVDIAEVGPSFTYEFEKSLDVSNEQSVMRTDGLHWSSDATLDIFDFVAFDKVTYWVYEYRESRSGQTFTLRIPKSSTPSTRELGLWYTNGPTEFPTSWVPVGRNLALGRPATQNSTYYSGTADRAVDGNTDGNYYNGSVSHTGRNLYSWWQVDLGSVQWVDAVQIWNRTDCCQSRLSNFYVFVSDVPFPSNNPSTLASDPNVWHYYVSGQGGRPTTVPVNSHGRYVRVQLTVDQNLHMAEVQVWGHPAEVSQWPKERPQAIDDNSFQIKLADGAYQTVNGQLKWDWTATNGIQVDRGGVGVGWETQDDAEWTTTVEQSTAENVAIGFEAKVLGAGVEGSYTYGSETRTSRALTWGSGTLIEGQTGLLVSTQTPPGISYNYSPYLWVQKATSSGKVQQEFLVLDYWVSSIGNPLETEGDTPAATKGITPTTPLIGSPSHPDPLTWYPASTVVFTWTQPAGDPATVAGYRRYLDPAADTIPSPASNGLTTTHTYRNVPDGAWYLHVRAGSDADQWSDTAHRAVRVDTQPPTVTLTLDPPQPTGHNGWYISPVNVAVVATDG
ncbi:MAG: discoidin domain-containing protein, partial [Chloroflexi bacterium]|nr:discoidin domain-containing protein [Chloroflexota bacterium]